MGFKASLPESLLKLDEIALAFPLAEDVSQFLLFCCCCWAATTLLVFSFADFMLDVSLLIAAVVAFALMETFVVLSVIFLLPLTLPLVPLAPPELTEFTEVCFTSLVFDWLFEAEGILHG